MTTIDEALQNWRDSQDSAEHWGAITAELITQAINAGHISEYAAAKRYGISRTTIRKWRQRQADEKGKP